MTGKGFEGRVVLTDAEHETYMRRMPVRYVKHKKALVCCVCGLPGTATNPLENAHRIPFCLGVRKFKLTPDYLDSTENIVTAHLAVCNKSCELSEDVIASTVRAITQAS